MTTTDDKNRSAIARCYWRLVRLFVMQPNRWYDNLSEPRRFLTFFLPLMAGQVVAGIAGGVWYAAWWGFLGLMVCPWRLAYFGISDYRGDKANDGHQLTAPRATEQK